ncbi:MAG: hypothetical protein MRK02_13005 [Candidatus Scalindua sp.]|nr:hypothetical protein [Candidatus Scalindua sp.]
MELHLPILILNLKVESKNISSTGVYFETTIDNSPLFQPGKKVNLKIVANTSLSMLPSKTVKLTGNGEIIRNTILSDSHHAKKLGIALRFEKKLEILV